MKKNNTLYIFHIIAALCLLMAAAPSPADAKVYIDIVSSPRQIPIAIQDMAGPSGRQLTGIITQDLEFSGLFTTLDKAAFLEEPEQAFYRENWVGLGVEAVVKGYVNVVNNTLMATVYVYDVFEGTIILKKLYSSSEDRFRALAHDIANDIYKKITGQESVFRTRIAFVKKQDKRQQLHLADWDGGNIRPLKSKGSIILQPHWTHDGQKLLYSIERNRKWHIYMLDIKRNFDKRVFASAGTNIAGNFFPNSKLFVLSSSRKGSPDIYTYDLKKAKLTRLTRDRGIEVSPSISPDGNTIAFVSDRGGTPQIYTMDKIGYNKTRITYRGRYNTSPVWSPNGKLLAYSSQEGGKHQIFVSRPDGSGAKKLTHKGNNEEPAFSPDGRFIVFTSDRNGKKGIYIMRVNGEAQKRITPRGVEASRPRWSPN